MCTHLLATCKEHKMLHASFLALQGEALPQPNMNQRPACQACSASYLYVLFDPCQCRWASTCKQAPSTPPAATPWQAMTPFSQNSLGLWHHRRAELTNRLCVTSLKVVFFYYPSLLATILSLFICFPIDPATPGSDATYTKYAQVRIAVRYKYCQCYASLGRTWIIGQAATQQYYSVVLAFGLLLAQRA